MNKSFNALYVTNTDQGFKSEIKTLFLNNLPENEVLIRVQYSSLNYKDALSASGNKGVTRKFPHVPGIDAAGIVESSTNISFKNGDKVLVTGYDLGMNTWGGFGEYISVPASWIVPLPENLTLLEAMSFGTAGFTAGLSIEKIVNAGILPGSGTVVVSGATGGVGSTAIAILSTIGYQVAAVSGKTSNSFLTDVAGATRIIDRNHFVDQYDTKPLSGADFSAGIDNVGGAILSGILKSVMSGGVVTSCGNVASASLNTSVFPFILRGITLHGIDSAEAAMSLRLKVWEQLANNWKPQQLRDLVKVIHPENLQDKLQELLDGKAQGRYVLKHRD
jgi:acrylyl-CoA reductase (NADPH)